MSAESMPGDESGLAQLNAVLQARGYIARPLDFGDLDRQGTGGSDGGDRCTGKSGAPSHDRDERSRKHTPRSRVRDFADIITAILADSARDLEAKTALAARVRVLEASLARQQKANALQREDLLLSQKQAAGAQAHVENATSLWTSEKAAHKTTQEDLAKLKRDLGGVRLLSSQAKHAAERRADLLKAKLSDVTIQTLLTKGCAADLRVVGGAFDLSGSGSSQVDNPLITTQIAALEEERSALLGELTAVKLFATECVNALRATGLQLAKQILVEQSQVSSLTAAKNPAQKPTDLAFLSRTTSDPAFVGDMFPTFVRYGSNNNQEHPALKALKQATAEVEHQASQMVLFSTMRMEQDQRLQLRDKAETATALHEGELDRSAKTTVALAEAIPTDLRQRLAEVEDVNSRLEIQNREQARELALIENELTRRNNDLANARLEAAQTAASLALYRERKAPGSETQTAKGTTTQVAPQTRAHPALGKEPSMSFSVHVDRLPAPVQHASGPPTDDQDGDTTPKEPPPTSIVPEGSTTPSLEGTVIDYGSEADGADETPEGPRTGLGKKRKAQQDHDPHGDDREVFDQESLGKFRHVSARLAHLEEVAARTPFAGAGRGANLAGPSESTPMPKRAKLKTTDTFLGSKHVGRRAGAGGRRHDSGSGSSRRRGSG